jgi:predicted 2-oxoglutarate/Fe(II)-dependent dioxygenase YbiX
LTQLILGTPAPMFEAESHVNPRFAISSVGGLFVLICFPPADPVGRAAAIAALARHRSLLDDERITAFVVLRDRAEYAARGNAIGLRWFLDEAGVVGELYGAGGEGLWVVLDPMQRVLGFAGMTHTERVFADLADRPPPDGHAGVHVVAPVLTVPRVLEPELCRRLIDLYEADGGAPSGTMRQQDGQTVGVHSNFKRRRDAPIEDEGLRAHLRARLRLRLLPEIAKAFQFQATRIERYIVACYDAADGGYFRAHRDNTTTGTAHRKFAVSINLNEDFDGGDLRFREFGSRTYRPPLGGAVVFSCSLLHEATPVTRGTRYATLPFLYDEEGARVRAANAHTLAGEVLQEQVTT